MADNATTIREWAQAGAALGDCGKMCNDCAFKVGTAANNDPWTACAALECLVYEMGKFNCHNDDLTDADKPCAGYLYAKQHLNKKINGK